MGLFRRRTTFGSGGATRATSFCHNLFAGIAPVELVGS